MLVSACYDKSETLNIEVHPGLLIVHSDVESGVVTTYADGEWSAGTPEGLKEFGKNGKRYLELLRREPIDIWYRDIDLTERTCVTTRVCNECQYLQAERADLPRHLGAVAGDPDSPFSDPSAFPGRDFDPNIDPADIKKGGIPINLTGAGCAGGFGAPAAFLLKAAQLSVDADCELACSSKNEKPKKCEDYQCRQQLID